MRDIPWVCSAAVSFQVSDKFSLTADDTEDILELKQLCDDENMEGLLEAEVS